MAEDFNSKPYASSFKPVSIAIYKAGDDSQPYANIVTLVTHVQYHESVLWPAYGATMVVVDNAENLVANMPIQGFERVEMKVIDAKEEEFNFKFRVWKVANRISAERRQIYTLCLISEEGLVNEGIRVNRVLSGNTDSVVKTILNDYLKVSELDSEPSATTVRMIPAKKTPFSVIRSLCHKTVSSDTYKSKSSSESSGSTTSASSDVRSTDAQKSSGTAGYFFFQTNKGYVFKSIDKLCKQGEEQLKKFSYTPGKTTDESLNKIQEVIFGAEIDIMQKMREGSYSSIVCFFNINTGKYEEYVYSLKDTWNDMEHLGSQTKLPVGQSTLSEYPTRVMSTIVNHENWYNGNGVASNEDKDLGEQDATNMFPDWQKQYLSQGLARLGIMFNQELTISITGHLELCAGDKVEIRINNQVPDQNREDEVWDPEHSGTYLIKKLNHQFDIANQNVYTVLELIRDSYGIKDKDTKIN